MREKENDNWYWGFTDSEGYYWPGDAEECAKKLASFPIKTQLKMRRILEIESLNSGFDGEIRPTEGGFIVCLKTGLGLKRKRLFALGHELGHTFFYTRDNHPKHIANLPKDYQLFVYGDFLHSEKEEDWCSNFAKTWMKRLPPRDKKCIARQLRKKVERSDG